MNERSRYGFFYSPDAEAIAGGASPAPVAAPVAAPEAAPAASTQETSIKLEDIAGGDRGTRTISPSKALGLPDAKSTLGAEIGKASQKNPHTEVKAREKKGEAAPATPAEPTAITPKVQPAAPAPATTNLPAKIKVGDKEYTEAELTALIAKPAEAPAAPAPAASASAPTAPSAPKTPEQLAAETAEAVKTAADKESEWLKANADSYKPEDFGLTPETFDHILSGGPDGVKAFMTALGQVAAKSALETRKAIADQLNPILDDYHNRMEPISTMYRQVEEYQQFASFEREFPDLSGKSEAYGAVKSTLMKHYPDQVRKMTQAEFNAEIAGHIRATAQAFGVAPTQAPAPAAAPANSATPSVNDLPPPPAQLPTPSATGSTPGTSSGPPPPTGQRGGIAGTVPSSAAAGQVNEMLRRQGISV